MYLPLLAVLLYCRLFSTYGAPQDIRWESKEISNIKLLHGMGASAPDESYSNIPSEAFTLDTQMAKRRLKTKKDDTLKLPNFTNKAVYSSGELSRLLKAEGEDLSDVYLIVVKKHAENEDITAAADDIHPPSQREEYPAGGHHSVVYHGRHVYGPTPAADTHRPRVHLPQYTNDQQHSMYLSKDLNPSDNSVAADDNGSHFDRGNPKVFPFTTNFKIPDIDSKNVMARPQPLVVYVNKEISDIDNVNGVKSSLRSQQSTPLPLSVYVERAEERVRPQEIRHTDTLEELINEMHDSRYPKPIQVYIVKEQSESESDVEHMTQLSRQINALNLMLHGENAPRPYTMYVENDVSSEETGDEEREREGHGDEVPLPGGVQHRNPLEYNVPSSSADTDTEHSVLEALCSELGPAFCAGAGGREVKNRL